MDVEHRFPKLYKWLKKFINHLQNLHLLFDGIASVLKPCWFIILTLLFSILFLRSPQGSDVLRNVMEKENIIKYVIFCFTTLVLAFSTWYCARWLLSVRYPPTHLPARVSDDSISRLVFILDGPIDGLTDDVLQQLQLPSD